jgi:hypothetical protein
MIAPVYTVTPPYFNALPSPSGRAVSDNAMNVDEGREIWEEIVLKYLRKRGFKAAEEAFKQEIDVKPKDEMSLQDRLRTHEGVIEGWISSIETRDDPQFAAKAFDTLLSWVDNSLDIYRVRFSTCFFMTTLMYIAMDTEIRL